MKKIFIVLIAFLFLKIVLAQDKIFSNLQIHYQHADQNNVYEGYTIEYHFQKGDFFYILSEIYNKEKQKRKNRLLKFNIKENLLFFFEEDLKNEVLIIDLYSNKESIFYKKKDGKLNVEKSKGNVFTYTKLSKAISKKIKNKEIETEIITLYISHFPLLKKLKIIISCENKEENPYFGLKVPVVVCIMKPKSKFLQNLKKTKASFIFQKESPHITLGLILEEKRYFYVTEYSTIKKERKKLINEVTKVEEIIKKLLVTNKENFDFN